MNSPYELKYKIGSGVFGDAYLVIDPNTDKIVAVKVINKQNNSLARSTNHYNKSLFILKLLMLSFYRSGFSAPMN